MTGKKSRIEEFIIISLLFLAAMNFQAKFFYFIFAAFGVFTFSKSKLKITDAVIPYILLGLLMGIYNTDEGILSVLRCFTYALCFILGSNFFSDRLRDNVENNFLQSTEKAYRVLRVLCWGPFVHFMLNFFYNFNGTMGRNTNDIWTGERLSATIQAALACMMTGLCISMIISAKSIVLRAIYVMAIIGVLMYNLVLSGRTLPLLTLVILIIGLLYFYRHEEVLSNKIKTTWIVAFILVTAALAFILNIADIRDYVMDSNLFDRLQNDIGEVNLIGGERTRRKLLFLKNMWEYPFGGLNMREQFGYAHDLLLDAYDEYGILSLFFLVIILASGISNLVCLCKNKKAPIFFKLSFLCVYVAILFEFCIEPILEGVPWMFACYCLLNGCIYGLNGRSYRENNGETDYEDFADQHIL